MAHTGENTRTPVKAASEHSESFEKALKAVEVLSEIDMVMVKESPSEDLLKRAEELTGLTQATLKYLYDTMVNLSREGY